MQRIGFLVNPIAGIGGRVGLKGSDGVLEEAIERGAEPSAERRARVMLDVLAEQLRTHPEPPDITWVTCAGSMGENALAEAGFDGIEVVHRPGAPSDAADTRRAVRAFIDAGVSLVVFCGGDGTARDVCAETGRTTPILGVPAGVKMYSAVFGVSPGRSAEILLGHLDDRLGLSEADVLDIDEESFRAGRLDVCLYDSARTPHEPGLIQAAKQVFTDRDERTAKAQIAEHVAEELESQPDTLFLLGPGSTVAAIADRVGLEKTLLGIDAVVDGAIVGRDLDERELLEWLAGYAEVRLVVSPIGAQGFVLGRGNQQLSPSVLRQIEREDIVIVATPAKLDRTRVLRFDTGDAGLDGALVGPGFLPVVTGYHSRRLVEARC